MCVRHSRHGGRTIIGKGQPPAPPRACLILAALGARNGTIYECLSSGPLSLVKEEGQRRTGGFSLGWRLKLQKRRDAEEDRCLRAAVLPLSERRMRISVRVLLSKIRCCLLKLEWLEEEGRIGGFVCLCLVLVCVEGDSNCLRPGCVCIFIGGLILISSTLCSEQLRTMQQEGCNSVFSNWE